MKPNQFLHREGIGAFEGKHNLTPGSYYLREDLDMANIGPLSEKDFGPPSPILYMANMVPGVFVRLLQCL